MFFISLSPKNRNFDMIVSSRGIKTSILYNKGGKELASPEHM